MSSTEIPMFPILEAITDGVVIASDDGVIRYVNRAVETLFGYPANELVGQNLSVLVPPPHRAMHPAYVQQLNETNRSNIVNLRREAAGMHRDGTVIPIDLHVGCCEVGNCRMYVGVVSDISDRKEAEWQINAHTAALEATNRELNRLRAQADSANHAKTSFLANMSHEIRTPMTAILGFADLLADGHLDGKERREAVDTIRRSGRHLVELISDILDLSKIEADHLVMEKTNCNIVSLVNDLISLFRVKAAEKRIGLTVEYCGELPEAIMSDPMRLRQMLSNLIGNAIKFTERGEVRVVVTGTLVAPRHCDLRCAVIDSGIGISAHNLPKLFLPFSQVDSSTTRRIGGTGLGLAISRRLARLLGGDIHVASQEGSGSTFTLALQAEVAVGAHICGAPQESIVSMDGQPSCAPPTPLLDRRILIAEDGPDNQRLISTVVRKAGADAVIAENGQVALETALAADSSGRAFDIIIMDMQMPVLDGYETTRALRQHGYTRPIIALTAHALATDRERCLAAGCDDFATKPIERENLIQLLVRHVRQVDDALQQTCATPGRRIAPRLS